MYAREKIATVLRHFLFNSVRLILLKPLSLVDEDDIKNWRNVRARWKSRHNVKLKITNSFSPSSISLLSVYFLLVSFLLFFLSFFFTRD